MNDQELLEMAAKAAGLKAQYSENYGGFSIGEPYSKGEFRWNPLDDDGDAFRLAFTLRLNIKFLGGFKQVQAARESDSNEKRYDLFGIVGYGPGTARDPVIENARRAIVRAAAEIGKSMP